MLRRARDLHHDRLLHLGAGNHADQFLPGATLVSLPAAALLFHSPLLFPQFGFAQQRLHPREVLLRFPQLFQPFRLPGGKLKAQAENLLAQLALLNFELVRDSCCGTSRFFPLSPPLQLLRPRDELRPDGDLAGRELHGLGRRSQIDARHLKHDPARLYHRHPVLRWALCPYPYEFRPASW